MTGKVAPQTLLVQLETALHGLVASFREQPYRFFTEADAVSALQTWVAARPELAQVYQTVDRFETGLLHREYPTFFRFKKSDPRKRLPPPARRGHYDLVLINPAYITRHDAETVHNRNIGGRGDRSTPPLLAAVEFKLFSRGWTRAGVDGVRQDVGELQLALGSPADASAAYLCVLQRDVRSTETLWRRYWPAVKDMLADAPGIRAVVAACWPNQEREPFVWYTGSWITAGPE